MAFWAHFDNVSSSGRKSRSLDVPIQVFCGWNNLKSYACAESCCPLASPCGGFCPYFCFTALASLSSAPAVCVTAPSLLLIRDWSRWFPLQHLAHGQTHSRQSTGGKVPLFHSFRWNVIGLASQDQDTSDFLNKCTSFAVLV